MKPKPRTDPPAVRTFADRLRELREEQYRNVKVTAPRRKKAKG